jgi:hypothetical protein
VFSVEVDLVAEMAVINPFDFFLEPDAEKFPFAYDPALAASSRRSAKAPATPAASRRYLASGRPRRARARSTSSSRSTSGCSSDIRYLIRLEPGVQTPEETLEKRQRLVPRLRLAAGAAAAPPRPRRALRLRLPDPARADVKSLDGPSGPRPTSPTCTPGARSTCRAPAGSASTRPPACSPARATSRSPARPSRRSAAPITGASKNARCEFEHEMSVTRITRRRASPSPTPTSSGPRSTRWASGRRRARAGDVRLTMGGEPTFVSIDDMDGAEWNTAALGPRKRARRPSCCAA